MILAVSSSLVAHRGRSCTSGCPLCPGWCPGWCPNFSGFSISCVCGFHEIFLDNRLYMFRRASRDVRNGPNHFFSDTRFAFREHELSQSFQASRVDDGSSLLIRPRNYISNRAQRWYLNGNRLVTQRKAWWKNCQGEEFTSIIVLNLQ